MEKYLSQSVFYSEMQLEKAGYLRRFRLFESAVVHSSTDGSKLFANQ